MVALTNSMPPATTLPPPSSASAVTDTSTTSRPASLNTCPVIFVRPGALRSTSYVMRKGPCALTLATSAASMAATRSPRPNPAAVVISHLPSRVISLHAECLTAQSFGEASHVQLTHAEHGHAQETVFVHEVADTHALGEWFAASVQPYGLGSDLHEEPAGIARQGHRAGTIHRAPLDTAAVELDAGLREELSRARACA